jgi:hypothetical protein
MMSRAGLFWGKEEGVQNDAYNPCLRSETWGTHYGVGRSA